MSALAGSLPDAAQWGADARFALYYAPPRTSGWWDAGCTWLGRDPESGTLHVAPQPPALERAVVELTVSPRRYGWHGTLVAPFRLAAAVGAADVLVAAREWARGQRRFTLPVEAALLGDFVALRPASDEGEARMRALASNALETLAALREKPVGDDLARRLEAPLTGRQRELLVQWGYPYVFDEFRFHMTLSSSLESAAERAALAAWWHEPIAALGPLPIDQAALFVEPARGAPFVLWQRLPFGADNLEEK